MAQAQRGQLLPDQQRQTRAGGVVGAVEQQGTGFRGDQRRDFGRIDTKAVFRAHRHRPHRRANRAEHPFVGHVHGFGDDHFVARVQHTLRHRIHRTLGAGHDDNLFGTDVLAAAQAMTSGNGVAQPLSATHRRVMRIARQQAVDGGVNDGPGRVEIRVANRQQQHVYALLAQRQRAIMDPPGLRAVAGNTLGQG
ncbi:hypothetical protein D3C73_760960 [compost metagenome]